MGDLTVTHTGERFDITNAPDEIDVSLSVLVAANPKALTLNGWTLSFGWPDPVRYVIVSWDHDRLIFHCHKAGHGQ